MSDTFEPYPAYKDSSVPWRGKISPHRESSITQPVIPANAGIHPPATRGFPPVREYSHER
jgi:hypothetical protein